MLARNTVHIVVIAISLLIGCTSNAFASAGAIIVIPTCDTHPTAEQALRNNSHAIPLSLRAELLAILERAKAEMMMTMDGANETESTAPESDRDTDPGDRHPVHAL